MLFCYSQLPLIAQGQGDPLFMIVTASEGVSLDGRPVTSGELVYVTSKQLNVPKKGYVGVVTIDGHAKKLTSTSQVAQVNSKIKWYHRPRRRAVYACGPFGPYITSAPQNQFAFILGDSLVLTVSDSLGAKKSYKIEIRSMFDELIKCDTIHRGWTKISIDKYFEKEEALLYSVNSLKNGDSDGQHLIRKIPETLKSTILNDVEKIPKTSISWEHLLAVYELNELYHDQVFLLYQMERSNYQSQNKIFANYINQLKKKYQFEQFDFHQ